MCSKTIHQNATVKLGGWIYSPPACRAYWMSDWIPTRREAGFSCSARSRFRPFPSISHRSVAMCLFFSPAPTVALLCPTSLFAIRRLAIVQVAGQGFSKQRATIVQSTLKVQINQDRERMLPRRPRFLDHLSRQAIRWPSASRHLRQLRGDGALGDIAELNVVQFRVQRTAAHQLVVRADVEDSPGFHHDHPVG